MTRRAVFTRDQITQAAFELIRRDGWVQVTARSIAAYLESSTMPIYTHMKSLQDLEQELTKRALSVLHSYQHSMFTEDPLLNLAVGYVTFARDEKHLFRFLFLDSPAEGEISAGREHFYSQFHTSSEAGRMLSSMPEGYQEGIIRNAYIYTHGLAMLVHAGLGSSYSDAQILELLKEAGEAFYLEEMTKENRRNEQ